MTVVRVSSHNGPSGRVGSASPRLDALGTCAVLRTTRGPRVADAKFFQLLRAHLCPAVEGHWR